MSIIKPLMETIKDSKDNGSLHHAYRNQHSLWSKLASAAGGGDSSYKSGNSCTSNNNNNNNSSNSDSITSIFPLLRRDAENSFSVSSPPTASVRSDKSLAKDSSDAILRVNSKDGAEGSGKSDFDAYKGEPLIHSPRNSSIFRLRDFISHDRRKTSESNRDSNASRDSNRDSNVSRDSNISVDSSASRENNNDLNSSGSCSNKRTSSSPKGGANDSDRSKPAKQCKFSINSILGNDDSDAKKTSQTSENMISATSQHVAQSFGKTWPQWDGSEHNGGSNMAWYPWLTSSPFMSMRLAEGTVKLYDNQLQTVGLVKLK